MQRDTAAPAAAPTADTAMPIPSDTGAPTTSADTTPVATPRQPSTAVAEQPSQKPAPAQPSPAPKPDSTRPKPNVDPGRTREPPTIPSSTIGQAQDTSTQQPLRDAYHQAPRDTVSQTTYNGWKQFNLNCARCHGEDVLGTTIAPHLVESLKPDGPINTKALFIQTVCHGRPEKGMPAWCPLGLDTTKIEQIYSYVKGRSEGKIHPGRPAVR